MTVAFIGIIISFIFLCIVKEPLLRNRENQNYTDDIVEFTPKSVSELSDKDSDSVSVESRAISHETFK